MLLLDADSLLAQALRTPPYSTLKNASTVFSGGVLGFMNSLLYTLEFINPDTIIAVWGDGMSPFRRDLWSGYARHRRGEKFAESQDGLVRLLSNLGIPSLSLSNREGRDVIYEISDLCPSGSSVSSCSPTLFAQCPELRSAISLFGYAPLWRDRREVFFRSILGEEGILGIAPLQPELGRDWSLVLEEFRGEDFEDLFEHLATIDLENLPSWVETLYSSLGTLRRNSLLLDLAAESERRPFSDDDRIRTKMILDSALFFELRRSDVEQICDYFELQLFSKDLDAFLAPFGRLQRMSVGVP